MVLESFNYFSTSLLFVLYLTQEFGVSDIEVMDYSPATCTRPVKLMASAWAHHALRLVQAGTLYGLWGTLLVVYGIAFSSVIDLFGAHSCTRMLPCRVLLTPCMFISPWVSVPLLYHER